MRRLPVIAAAAMLALATPAGAHHSFAAFDRERQVTLTGVVKELQWNNPHAWVQVVVTDEKGRQTEWGLECGSPNMMARTGWKRSTLKPGDKETAVAHPLKEGRSDGARVRL